MHAVELASGHRQVAGHARPGRQDDGVEARAQLLHAHVASDVHPAAQLHALRGQLLDAALHDGLLDLEVRHPEAHEPADGLVALEQGDTVTRPAQLLGRGHARRSGADHRHPLAGVQARGLGQDPALLEGAVDDGVLDLLDRDRVALLYLEHARRLARRRAQAAGELGKVVGRVQLGDRVLPAIAVDEIVPVGDQVPERAAVVAEGNPAVHAAGALLAQVLHRTREQELAVVVRALGRIPLGNPVTLDLQKPPQLAHQAPISPTASSRTAAATSPLASRGTRRESLPLCLFVKDALVVMGHHLHE